MSRKKAIIFSIVIVLTAIFFGVYFSITKNKVEQTRDITSEPLTFKDFLPFGTGITPVKTDDENTVPIINKPVEDNNGSQTKKIKQVSLYPIAGAISFFKEIPIEETIEEIPKNTTQTKPKTRKVLYTRQVDKATGRIYETNMETMEEMQITNTTIPRIYEAYLSGDAKNVIYRYLGDDNQTIETYTASINEEDKKIVGTALPSGITDMTVDQNGSRLFYLFKFGGTSVGNTALINGDKKTEVFKSKITEWLPFWIDSKTLGFQTKASAYSLGYFYSYDLTIKSLNKIIGGISGLTTLPNRGNSMVIYSGTIENSFNTSIYNVTKKQSIPLDNPTMPEKCVWNSTDNLYCSIPQYIEKNIYPDSWYQGLSTFSDSFYEVDATTGFSTLISSPGEESIRQIDGIKLFLSSDESYLFIINKKDDTLWSVNLK